LYSPSQKEHSNLITNLRATNEMLFTVTEHAQMTNETKEDGKEEAAAQTRTRKKLERNPSAPTPGMLQVKTFIGSGFALVDDTRLMQVNVKSLVCVSDGLNVPS
jgi:hypothetical protein